MASELTGFGFRGEAAGCGLWIAGCELCGLGFRGLGFRVV